MTGYAQYGPHDFRQLIRAGVFKGPTAGCCDGYAQANLAILRGEYAEDFTEFARLNPKPCPILDVIPMGSTSAPLSPGSDIRTDIPGYRVYRNGVLTEELDNLIEIWQDDYVAFLLGCSFTFEWALLKEAVPVRHIEAGCNVPMYKTNIPCNSTRLFHGNTVVSMRPIPEKLVDLAVEISGRYPEVHGAPIHIGNPETIGIHDVYRPDYGDPVEIRFGETPVFWACGVTPQLVALSSKPDLMITHAPGYMFVTDIPNDKLSSLKRSCP